MQNKYKYNLNLVDNILGITNSANSQNITEKNKAKLGVAYSHSYTYDGINRLVSANGKAKTASYWLDMTYGIMGEPLTKKQKVDSSKVAQSYAFAYLYEAGDHPTAPSQIGHNHNTYDANGNPLTVTNDGTSETREMYWDEDNWLMVLSDNGKTSRYTYNASGERIIKSHGTMEGVYINGAPQGITFHETDNFTLYPASILTVNKNRFTKHYFIGSQRIASRIGTGLFNNVYGRNGSYVTAGQQDYAERMNQIQKQKETYYKQQGIAPGVPTEKGAYGDPENTHIGYNSIIRELGNHDVPQGWVQTPHPNTTPDTSPGPPVSWNDPSNPDDPQAGYGYIANDTTREETFFYHSDHLGSTSYITDDKANITQYDAYLPYGELLVDEHSSSEDLPYKFNGKQFDEETGLYYYGARYMNPVTSLWYGVDPLAEKYPAESVHTYTHNNPVKFIDPNGKVAWIAVGAFAGGLINAGIAAYQGKSAREIAGAALSGAVSGALIASGAGFMATAAGGTVASLGETLIGKGHINKRDIAESVVSNVVSAGIGTGVGKIIGKGATKLTAKVANKYASSVVRQAFRKEVKSEIKRTLGTTSGKYAKQLANRMVNRRVSVNRQFDSHLVLFGKNATNYPVQTAIGVAVGKTTPSMFSYGYSTYKRFTSNGKRF